MPSLPDSQRPTVCRRLRSKGTPGVTYSPSVDFDAGYISTATFWCLATADATGPDDSYVHPHVCVHPRICFTPPPAADEPKEGSDDAA
ncbi:MAG TPA: hypothetical protein VGN72_23370 [Tepidisphaeraceae bacterium]|nr:hypothetical protein [Tepidisphaeraceae bacterium]